MFFNINDNEENPKEQERGGVELNLFGDGSPKKENSERDSKAFALISQSASGNWVQKGSSSENKVLQVLFLPPYYPPFRCCPLN